LFLFFLKTHSRHHAMQCRQCTNTEGEKRRKFWCGYVEIEGPDSGARMSFVKTLDLGWEHPQFFCISKSFGVDRNWARRWRYRLYAHRSSFQGEAQVLNALQPDFMPDKLDNMLLQAWVRSQLWRRASETSQAIREKLAVSVLQEDLEALLDANNGWYAPMMFRRRLSAWRSSGDRLDICAMDGNAKLYRRTCGAPCAETVYAEALDFHLVRGCSESPTQKGVLCHSHEALRANAASVGQIEAHRMRKPLDASPFLSLDVRLAGFCN
jgi:hypothetical protein